MQDEPTGTDTAGDLRSPGDGTSPPLGMAAARSRAGQSSGRARAGEPCCAWTITRDPISLQLLASPRACVRPARWNVSGRQLCTIHAKLARKREARGHIKPAMVALASGPPCTLCQDRGVLRVGKASVIPAWCVCTPLGRELANGRPDDEVLRELELELGAVLEEAAE